MTSDDRVRQFAAQILHGDEEHRSWLAEAAECFIQNQPLPIPRGKGSSPTPDGVIKDREDGRDPSGPGSQASPGTPMGCRPEGFDPSRLMTAKWLDPQCISSGCQSLLWHERYQDACRGRREFREAFRRVRRQLRELERARDEQPKVENPKGLSPQGASPVRAAEAPTNPPDTPSSQEGGVGEVEGWVLVPREPTPWMIHVMRYGTHDAALIGINDDPISGETPYPNFGPGLAKARYQAALNAAPRPSQREG